MTSSPAPIQIWQPVDGSWIRPPQSPLGDHYAAERTLRKRVGTGRRVVLAGESVAAGYLFAPHYTPAIALQERLDTWEVIDLARTNESLSSLAETIDQSLQLEPDVVVIWAGNNWMLRDFGHLSPYHPASTSRRGLGQLLRDAGPGGVAAVAERTVRGHVLPALDAIADQIESAKAHLVVVIPEVNLVDWEHAQPVTVLNDGAESRWYEAFSNGDHHQMLHLDQGSCATTHRLAGNDLSGEDAVASYRQEVAAAAGPLRGCTSSPMATAQVQELLREWTNDRSISTVDVPAVIAADGSPDRSWFLDYCHHTATAINTISGLIATNVDEDHRGQPVDADPELIAVASLGALMHTDHRLVSTGDRQPLLRHLRRSALEACDGAEDLVRDLIESRLGETPVPLSSAQHRNLERSYPFGFAHGWRPHTSEAEALAALGLKAEDCVRWHPPVERAWPPNHGWRPGQVTWIDEKPGSAAIGYFRSVQPHAHFAVLVRPGTPVDLELTARLPTPGPVHLRLGTWTTTVRLDDSWTTVRLSVDPDAPPGPQRLTVTWPPLAHDTSRWNAALADLEADRVPELHPIFGHVHSLKAH